ncbi:MAG: type II toxin-antitoxin system Phd/YefM family antitoxin [Thermoplasmata archaeon]
MIKKPRTTEGAAPERRRARQRGKPRIVGAGEFKAKCLAFLDEVSQTGAELLVTKRGKPVARVLPAVEPPSLRNSVLWEGDIVSPIGEKWNADL